MTRLVGGAHSDVGRVRSVNQDAALASSRLRLFAVADGMGGHRGGEVASALALEALTAGTDAALDTVDTLVDLVLDANDRILDQARRDPDLFGMGTTLCAIALVRGDDDAELGAERVAIVNVGDSRVYLLAHGALQQLTEDHSLVQDMVRDGQLTAEEAAVHPRRNILTRALGIEPEVDVDWWERPARLTDRYLLCSDGLFNEVSEDRIAAVLRQVADPEAAAKELVGLANARGGRDNITCIVVDVVGDAGPEIPADPGPTAARRLEADLAAAEPVPPPEPRPRRVTFRVLGFLVLLGTLAAVTVFVIRTFADRTYFVAAGDDRVAVYQGRPGGILWFDPRVVETLPLQLTALTAAQREQLATGYETSSRDDARRWAVSQLSPVTTTTTTPLPSTTTTVSTTTAPPTSLPPTSIATTTATTAAAPPPEGPAVTTADGGG